MEPEQVAQLIKALSVDNAEQVSGTMAQSLARFNEQANAIAADAMRQHQNAQSDRETVRLQLLGNVRPATT